MTIPKVLHRVVPETTTPLVEDYWRRFGELHPGWELRTWRDPLDPGDFPLLGHLFRYCKTGAGLADLIRLEVLWQHGGVYVDSDCEPVRALDPLLVYGCFIGCEELGVLTNAVMGAEPQHPAIKAYIDAILARGPKGLRESPDYASGPRLVTRVWRGRDDVSVLDPVLFYAERPNSDPLELRPTAEDLRERFPEALVVHRWAHSWAPPPPLTRRVRAAVRHARWLMASRGGRTAAG